MKREWTMILIGIVGVATVLGIYGETQASSISQNYRFGPTSVSLWAANDPQMQELTIPFVGPERADWQYSIGSVAAAGGHVAFGSDWPVSSPDPLQEIHVAVNRVRSARAGEPGTPECEMPFRPSEAMSVAASLAAFTSGVAFVNGTEDSLGTLAEGYRADVAVLDQDLFEIAPSAIGDTSVEVTIAGGKIVHGA